MTQVVSEIRKVATTWTWWLVLAAMAVYSGGFAAFTVLASTLERSPLQLGSPETVVVAYNVAIAVAYVFPLAMGVVVVTNEYRSKLIAQTLLANPSRWSVYGAKTVTGLGLGLLYSVVATAVCVGAGAGLLALLGEPAYLTSAPVIGSLLGTVVALSLWGLIGVGVGALVRNQVVAVVGVLVLTQFVEPMARSVVLGLSDSDVSWVLPGGAGDAAAGGTLYSMMNGVSADSQLPGFLMLGAYALVFCALGAWRFTRYEAA
ncbi:ABC transporter permease [Streptomonospora algeriensis]|uniref:ABC transporter permease n=1 Tax=Streptomonospora algeriensis TaxID=995084 RepID=A0ABW3BEK4_9ACTN